MEEKVMVVDALESINANLSKYGEMIPQTDNTELKQTLKQIRNQCILQWLLSYPIIKCLKFCSSSSVRFDIKYNGGLKDTVIPYNEYESSGTGFSFANYNAHEMLNAIPSITHCTKSNPF